MQKEEGANILSTTTASWRGSRSMRGWPKRSGGCARARGMAKKAIARELGLDIKTVRKWATTDWKPQRRERKAPALAKYDEWIRKRFPEVAYSAKVLHRELGELGYEGSYVTVQRYVRPLRTARQPEVATARYDLTFAR